ncbi:F-box protein At2g35280-like [Rutidosis leptorrhynchoides]|uniref:F-box protein At2g35280-like n=1 Tax=Rutidosis leptorrhynchoides TaxID=125765 RepID=UPI003A9A0C60
MAATQYSIVEALPQDMLAEILSRVGRDSCQQLFLTKTVCRDFSEVSFDPLVFKRLCLDRFPIVHFGNPKLTMLFDRCFFYGNPNMIYRRGLTCYFNSHDYTELGLRLLKQATEMKVLEAVYVYGLIMFAKHEIKFRDVGLQILIEAFPPLPDLVVAVRNRVFAMLSRLWLFNRQPFEEVATRCPNLAHQGYWPDAHGWEQQLQPPDCMSCFWAFELGVFVQRFHYQ